MILEVEFIVKTCVPSLTRNEKKKDNICILFAVYAAMSEKQNHTVTVSVNLGV